MPFCKHIRQILKALILRSLLLQTQLAEFCFDKLGYSWVIPVHTNIPTILIINVPI